MQAPHAPTLRSEQQASHAVQKPLTGSAQRRVPAPAAWSDRRPREALVLRSCGKAAAPVNTLAAALFVPCDLLLLLYVQP